MKIEQKEFREELQKLLPGYNWTVHKTSSREFQTATGIQSRGFNRTSTITVVAKKSWYESKIAGYGLRAPSLATGFGQTLTQAIRTMQTCMEREVQVYTAQLANLRNAQAK